MIILDLDDTIFETKTMDPGIFDSAISVIKNHFLKHSKTLAQQIVAELWQEPIDVVAQRHDVPEFVMEAFFAQLSKVDYKSLNIQTYDDYEIIKEFSQPKILVTTGVKELQNAKIDALGIREDFKSIHIDDPRSQPRNTKFKIFLEILNQSNLKPENIWVIGDNPDSEIQAGHKLGMKTIQRRSPSKSDSEIADFKIDSFRQLRDILV